MKVLITDSIAKEGVEVLKTAGIEVEEKIGITKETLQEIINDYQGLIVRSATKVTKEIITSAHKLKVIGRAGVGLDNIDLESAKERGITVFNTPGATSISVAELALGMMLACARKLPQATESVKAKKWEKRTFSGMELYGKVLGIIGLGKIGLELAKRAHNLGMQIIATDIIKQNVPYIEMVELKDILARSDFISIHVPLTDATRHLIGKKEIDLMKEGVILINCARGGIVDENALYEALKTGKIKAAGLDIFEQEPPINSPLLELDNVVLTPHIGGETKEGQLRAGIEIAEKIRDFLSHAMHSSL